ncbi:MAG: hypothetical protein IAF02_07710, partial [Anaerolineae bacterium]|nr:hypothetical protein [Anaerolineae bacterium]
MHKLVRILIVILVVILAWVLRARAVDLLPIDYDEDDYLRAAQQMAVAIQAGDWAALTELNYRSEHPPLAKLVYGTAISSLPPTAEIPDRPTTAQPAVSLPQPHLDTARRVSAFFGTLEVLLLALLNPLAALFLGIHTWTIKYSSQVMLEALPAFTSAAAVVTYDWSQVYEKGKRRRWGWLLLLLSAVLLGLTAAAKYLYALVGIAILIHWGWSVWRYRQNGRFPLKWFLIAGVWGVGALLIFFAANPYLWPDPVGRLLASIFYHQQYSQSAAVQDTGWPMWQSLVWLLGSVVWHPGVFVVMFDLFIAAFALVGLREMWRKRPLYAIWLIVAFIFLLLWPTKWPQYVLTLTFPLSLSAALGVTAVVIQPLRHWWQQTQQNGLIRSDAQTRHSQRQQFRRAFLWL